MQYVALYCAYRTSCKRSVTSVAVIVVATAAAAIVIVCVVVIGVAVAIATVVLIVVAAAVDIQYISADLVTTEYVWPLLTWLFYHLQI